MPSILKHIQLKRGVALLLDNGMVEILGQADHLRSLSEFFAYRDDVEDIANSYLHGFPYRENIFYKFRDVESWETTQDHSGGRSLYASSEVSTVDTSHGKYACDPELCCTIQQYGGFPYEHDMVPSKGKSIRFHNPEAGKPIKCLQCIYTSSAYYRSWCLLTDLGKCFVHYPDWEEKHFANYVKDIFSVNRDCVFLFNNGKLFSNHVNIPEYLRG
jgi:hypothetical protein